MKNVQIEDIERLAYEIAGYADNSEEWAAKVGMSPEVIDGVGNVATNAAHEKSIQMAREAFEASGIDLEALKEDEEGDSIDGLAMKMDIGEVIKSACISTFVLGFETCRQYGGGDVKG